MTHKQEPRTIAPTATVTFKSDENTIKRNPWYRLIYEMDIGEKSNFWLAPGGGLHKDALLQFCLETKIKIPWLESDLFPVKDLLAMLPIQLSVSKMQVGGTMALQMTDTEAMVKKQFDRLMFFHGGEPDATKQKFYTRAQIDNRESIVENAVELKVLRTLHKHAAFQKVVYLRQYVTDLCNALMIDKACIVLGQL